MRAPPHKCFPLSTAGERCHTPYGITRGPGAFPHAAGEKPKSIVRLLLEQLEEPMGYHRWCLPRKATAH